MQRTGKRLTGVAKLVRMSTRMTTRRAGRGELLFHENRCVRLKQHFPLSVETDWPLADAGRKPRTNVHVQPIAYVRLPWKARCTSVRCTYDDAVTSLAVEPLMHEEGAVSLENRASTTRAHHCCRRCALPTTIYFLLSAHGMCDNWCELSIIGH